MTAITLDHLSNGRLILGLGVSGPQVVEGWYGQKYRKPLARTREYVEILRRVFKREEVDFQGEHYKMPLGADAGGTGLGKPLKSIVKPLRDDIPIHLGAEGPKNVALAAEIADGWLPIFFSPKSDDYYRAALAEGFARPGARHTPDDFEVSCVVPVDRRRRHRGLRRPAAADVRALHRRHGRPRRQLPLRRVQPPRLRGRLPRHPGRSTSPAARTRPSRRCRPRSIEDVALIGPAAKIAEDLERWKATCLTTMLVSGPAVPARADR